MNKKQQNEEMREKIGEYGRDSLACSDYIHIYIYMYIYVHLQYYASKSMERRVLFLFSLGFWWHSPSCVAFCFKTSAGYPVGRRSAAGPGSNN